MNKRLWRWTWAVLVIGMLAACGDDSDDGGGTSAGTGGAAGAAGGTAGTGGGSGRPAGGAGGMAGSAGAPVTSITCGTNTCTAPALPIPGIMLPPPCCVQATMTCGTMPMGSTTCVPPLEQYPGCPVITDPLPLITCCADNNLCGVDASMFNMGCLSFEAVEAGPFGALLTLPVGLECDSDGGVDADAGN
jgi:hypothetical protein